MVRSGASARATLGRTQTSDGSDDRWIPSSGRIASPDCRAMGRSPADQVARRLGRHGELIGKVNANRILLRSSFNFASRLQLLGGWMFRLLATTRGIETVGCTVYSPIAISKVTVLGKSLAVAEWLPDMGRVAVVGDHWDAARPIPLWKPFHHMVRRRYAAPADVRYRCGLVHKPLIHNKCGIALWRAVITALRTRVIRAKAAARVCGGSR